MSEAKTKAVQAEAKQEAKTVAKTQETMVYAGPTILGVATHNQFFNNGLPDGLKTAMEKEPAIYNLVAPVTGTAGLQVIIGTAPVNLAADPYKATNVPMIAYSFSEAVEQVGYSDDFKNYTLCQSMDACFRVLNVAPIILINVLDPKKHKKANEEQTVNAEKMQATVKVAGILADTVEVKANRERHHRWIQCKHRSRDWYGVNPPHLSEIQHDTGSALSTRMDAEAKCRYRPCSKVRGNQRSIHLRMHPRYRHRRSNQVHRLQRLEE